MWCTLIQFIRKTQGFQVFVANSTITYFIKNGYPQLTTSVTNKLLVDVKYYKDRFGGNIYFDKSQNGYYKWSIQGKSDIDLFHYYVSINPLLSNRNKDFSY